MADRDRNVASAMQALEGQIHDLHHMCGICADLLERQLSSNPKEVTGRADTYILPSDAVDRMLFAVYHARVMARELTTSFLDALKA